MRLLRRMGDACIALGGQGKPRPYVALIGQGKPCPCNLNDPMEMIRHHYILVDADLGKPLRENLPRPSHNLPRLGQFHFTLDHLAQ